MEIYYNITHYCVTRTASCIILFKLEPEAEAVAYRYRSSCLQIQKQFSGSKILR